MGNEVDHAIETKDGTLWFATPNGVARYVPNAAAPKRFITYTLGDRRANRVHALCEDLRGGLWIGTDAGLFHASPAADGLHSGFVLRPESVSGKEPPSITPTPIRDVEIAAHAPLQVSTQPASAGSSDTLTIQVPAPAGKRFVLEHLSVNCHVNNGDPTHLILVQLFTADAFAAHSYLLGPVNAAVFRSSQTIYYDSQPILTYQDGGTPLLVIVSLDQPSSAATKPSCTVSVSGYTVNTP